mmetsp:Transcript_1234/g.2728  ORF Transcript_1234/g.2728 Transcript_1234/m.2728 type:complete len:155 (-) Transcript_1234:92-556(-)
MLMRNVLRRVAPRVPAQVSRATACAPARRWFSDESHPDFQPKVPIPTSFEDLRPKLQALVDNNKVVLFMKGRPDAPQCGFSKTVAGILAEQGVEDYTFVDVLKHPEVRDGVKIFSDWPTIPQLYINGEFVGGCDIVLEMNGDGSLAEALKAEKK